MTTRSTIPVHILTGFLGSGKTTLLNRALASAFGPETAVVVNEMGEIALDHLFIESRSEETIVLKSGCVCCTVRTDLVSTLMQLAAMSDSRKADSGAASFRRIVIETSGISDPVPILTTLRSDFNLLTRFHIGSIVSAVDATADDSTRGRHEVLMQVAASDLCVVTKGDLADETALAQTQGWVRAVNPMAEVVAASAADLAAWLSRDERVTADIDARLSALEAIVAPAEASHRVRSVVIRSDDQMSWPAFAVWLSALVFQHGDRILRIKGMLRDDERQSWIAVHGVRRFLHPPEHLPEATRGPACGACLVFITEDLDPALIETSYRRWVIAQSPDAAQRQVA